jgi:cytochrome c biogenesis protein CcmG/thiol:disulfide interchange protein DsbE
MQLAQRGVPVVGVAIRDAKPDVDGFLARYGNPYEKIGLDARSAIQFAIGSSGVPETFIVDGKGIIRYQHIGDIRPEHIPMLLEKLEEASR